MEAGKWTLSRCTAGKSEEDAAAGDEHRKAVAELRRTLQQQAELPAASVVGKSKRRLTKSEIRSILALKPEPLPSDDYPEALAEFFPPEWIEEKRRQQEEEVAILRQIDEQHEAFRQQVIKGLEEKGYYEVDEDYLDAREKANEYALHHVRKPFADVDPSELRRRVATPEEERLWRQGDGYVPDEADTRLIGCGDEDFRSDEEEDSSE